MKRLGIVLSAILLVAAGAAFYAQARTQADAGTTLTGCLKKGGEEDDNGAQLTRLAIGASPARPCKKNETVVHLGNGDVTGVVAGTGLEGGAASGEATLGIASAFRLPQNCATGQAPVWGGSAPWGCATFAASNQSCQAGDVVTGVGGDGKVACADPLGNLKVQQLAAGDANCANGGVAISVKGTASYACNGASGPKGDPGAKGDAGGAGPPGAQGPPGTISSAASPNGIFRVTLDNRGIVLSGPTGSVVVDYRGAKVISP